MLLEGVLFSDVLFWDEVVGLVVELDEPDDRLPRFGAVVATAVDGPLLFVLDVELLSSPGAGLAPPLSSPGSVPLPP